MIIIVDYGIGNLASLENIFNHIGANVCISRDKEKIINAKKIILPGVGSFGSAINKLDELELTSVLNNFALDQKKPVLGICLGMQLMTNYSEEGNLPGLSWINATTKKIPILKEIKVPHMGWSTVKFLRSSSLHKNLSSYQKFYFANSYYVKCHNPANSLAKIYYGALQDVVINVNNIYGVQFHPEKSHRFGMNLLKNFALL